MEPAVSSAALVLQTMLGAPFAWPWNRGILNYTSAAQDFVYAGLTTFDHLEGGSIAPSGGGVGFELQVKNLVQSEQQQQGRPYYLSPLIDDGQGNITFRLSPAPGQSYAINAIFQKKCPTVASLAQTWAPVPDQLNYIPQWGFLAMMSLIGNDARFNEYNAKFITGLLGAQGGLTDLERNIFLSNWTRVMAQLQGNQLATSERYKARET